jgi:four helix bundle protein
MKNENQFPFQKLDVYGVARELARRVHTARIRDRELRDQATRAAKSCFLCLCEGLPNEGAALRHKYFVEARNSLAETVGAMDLAAAIGVVRCEDADAVQELGSRLRRMLTALLR